MINLTTLFKSHPQKSLKFTFSKSVASYTKSKLRFTKSKPFLNASRQSCTKSKPFRSKSMTCFSKSKCCLMHLSTFAVNLNLLL